MVRIQTYLHHPTYGQVRSLPDAVRAVKGRHSSGAPAVNASLAPTSAIVDNAKPEYQSAGFGCPIAKAFFKMAQQDLHCHVLQTGCHTSHNAHRFWPQILPVAKLSYLVEQAHGK
ncbi:TPA: hypothetical protein ACH3X3_001596 [Trebouxia sp. C0006]